MEKVYQFIIENTVSGKMSRELAVELLKMLKKEQRAIEPIAIIGMAARMPSSGAPAMFWKMIQNKTDCIQACPEARKQEVIKYFKYKKHPVDELKFPEMAYLEDIDKFDCGFFRLSPKEASYMDPNQRLFLEIAWSALEDAGYGGEKLKGSKTGVYLGFGNNSANYGRFVSEIDPLAPASAVAGNLAAIIAARISYLLDLKGPALLIDTACSSSLVAVHLACQGIRNGDCDFAIAGGVKIELGAIETGYRLGIESSDGRTRTFDDASDGTGGGEGVAAILLKPLAKALKDNDHIYAVIKGSAINQDGSSIGITAPNVTAQEEVILQAWENAGIDPETITYLEAHGTGTKLGDPIEIEGISRAFQKYTQKRQFCAIGSLKSNTGHLDHAAGIAGLLKTVLALKYRELPPTIHFQRPNRKIHFEDSPVYVNDRLIPWETGGFPRRAGVSAFGLSGANCHIVLEEAPQAPQEEQVPKQPQIFTVSAKSLPALMNLIKAYREYLATAPESVFYRICYTANTGRGHYSYRLAIIANNSGELKEKIKQLQETGLSPVKDPAVFYGSHQLIAIHPVNADSGYLTYEQKSRMDLEADTVIEEIAPDLTPAAYRERLSKLAGLYVRGADIPWEKLYTGQRIQKLSLPTYVFERNRHWIEIPEIAAPERLYYTVSWVESAASAPANASAMDGATLIFNIQPSMVQANAAQWKNLGDELIWVGLGPEFRGTESVKLGGPAYQIDGGKQSYEKLMLELSAKKIARILYFTDQGKDLAGISPFNQNRPESLHGLLYLFQALLHRPSNEPLEIIIIAQQAYRITGLETGLNPQAATLFGLAKAAGLENPHFKCRCLDMDSIAKITEIIAEILAGAGSFLTAYREGRRYEEIITELPLETIANQEIKMGADGAVLITGGTGGIGLEFAKHLARKQPLKIALVNRSPIPERAAWDKLLKESADPKLKRKLQAFREIERYGGEVACYRADVAKREEIEPVLHEIRQKYGKIRGIIHAAGTGGGSLIVDETPESLDQALAAKTLGTWWLDHLTRQDDPDFFIMFSSAITIVSGVGSGAYTAANAYLDAYAGYRNREGKRTLTINWPAWKETGLAEGALLDEDKQIFKPLQPGQALAAFEKVFQKDLSNVIIGELNYASPVFLFKEHLPFQFSKAISAEIHAHWNQPVIPNQSPTKSAPVLLKGQASGGYTEIQLTLAQIWGKVFGLTEVSIYTNFAELGGDSILALNLTREIEAVYPGVINITHVFSYPTIAEMAAFIEKTLKGRSEPSGADAYEIMDRLNKGELTVNEASKLMEKVGKKTWN
ncbi:MAG: SDR family oxidoreductase [Firmicutes bacterium]|nr:SDR family oxidoreductase [Bacillota bacterium]